MLEIVMSILPAVILYGIILVGKYYPHRETRFYGIKTYKEFHRNITMHLLYAIFSNIFYYAYFIFYYRNEYMLVNILFWISWSYIGLTYLFKSIKAFRINEEKYLEHKKNLTYKF